MKRRLREDSWRKAAETAITPLYNHNRPATKNYLKIWFNTPEPCSGTNNVLRTKFGIKPAGIINFLSNGPPFCRMAASSLYVQGSYLYGKHHIKPIIMYSFYLCPKNQCPSNNNFKILILLTPNS
jgi:hypothetical protein